MSAKTLAIGVLLACCSLCSAPADTGAKPRAKSTSTNSKHSSQVQRVEEIRPIAPVTISQSVPPPATPQSVPPLALRVEWNDGKLNLDAKGVPLCEVLGKVASQTGIEFQGITQLRYPVFARLSAATLAEAFENLLSKLDYAITGDLALPSTPAHLIRVLILTQRAEEEQAVQVGQAPGVSKFSVRAGMKSPVDTRGWTDQQKRQAEIENSIKQHDKAALLCAFENPDRSVANAAFEAVLATDHSGAIDALLAEAKSDQTRRRLQALQLLDQTAKVDEGIRLSTFHDALEDEAMAVRQYAIQALTRMGGSEAMSYLSDAFQDPDPAVRLAVLQTVAGKDEGAAILEEGLADSDPTVQRQAEFWLQQRRSKGK